MNHQVHHFIARTQLNLSAAFSLGNYSVLFPHAFTFIVAIVVCRLERSDSLWRYLTLLF